MLLFDLLWKLTYLCDTLKTLTNMTLIFDPKKIEDELRKAKKVRGKGKRTLERYVPNQFEIERMIKEDMEIVNSDPSTDRDLTDFLNVLVEYSEEYRANLARG